MKKTIIILLFIFVIIALIGAGGVYAILYRDNVATLKPYQMVIYQNTDKQEIVKMLQDNHVLNSSRCFLLATELTQCKEVRKGKYTIYPQESNLQIIRKLKKGNHYPVSFTFNNIRLQSQFVDKVGNNFLFLPDSLNSLLNNSAYMAQFNVNKENKLSIFIPNTYELYYDISADEFIRKMYAESLKFWTPERTEKAKTIGLTAIETIILASIVEEENFKNQEKAIIAGVYLNRLNRGMILQADPTVKYAWGDFSLKRVLTAHTLIDSPYNTYKYAGLPPGPIRMPEISTIDSVLNYRRHNWLYMCAKEDFSGRHNFSTTLAEHEHNRAKYIQALNKLNYAKK